MELLEAVAAVAGSVKAFGIAYAWLTSGAVSVDEVERLEAQLDEARRLTSGVMRSVDELRLYLRKALVEADADGWVCRDGDIDNVGPDETV